MMTTPKSQQILARKRSSTFAQQGSPSVFDTWNTEQTGQSKSNVGDFPLNYFANNRTITKKIEESRDEIENLNDLVVKKSTEIGEIGRNIKQLEWKVEKIKKQNQEDSELVTDQFEKINIFFEEKLGSLRGIFYNSEKENRKFHDLIDKFLADIRQENIELKEKFSNLEAHLNFEIKAKNHSADYFKTLFLWMEEMQKEQQNWKSEFAALHEDNNLHYKGILERIWELESKLPEEGQLEQIAQAVILSRSGQQNLQAEIIRQSKCEQTVKDKDWDKNWLFYCFFLFSAGSFLFLSGWLFGKVVRKQSSDKNRTWK